jgi:hypothetical protein
VPRDLPGRYDRHEQPEHGSSGGLADRLDQLPASHPSSPCYRGADAGAAQPGAAELPTAGSGPTAGRGRDGQREGSRVDPPGISDRGERYADGARPADWQPRGPADETSASAGLELAEPWLPAGDRPEWQEPLARGEVDRVGPGVVDERAIRFQPQERRIADYLASEGRAVVAIHDDYGREGRRLDAAVDDLWTEFKSLDPGASNTTVKAALTSAKGQARHAVIDGRGSGLDGAEAERGLRRFLGTPHAGSVAAIRVIGDHFDLDWKRG